MWARRIGALAAAAWFGYAALVTIRLAYVEMFFRRGTSAAIERAAALDGAAAPAGYFERLSALAGGADSSAGARWLEAALAFDPRKSSDWIALGLHHERERDYAEAERDLLQAARVDRQYLPAWTLANFYFRRGNAEAFWLWARRAAQRTYDDYRPLLQLAHAADPNARAVLAKLGGGEKLVRADLDFLIGQGGLDQAQQVARILLQERSPADKPRLLDAADRQIRAGNTAYALEIWNAFFPPLDPAHGSVLTDGDFSRAPLNSGFGWRLPQAEDVTAQWRPSELTLSFSGEQPEACSALEQFLPLAPRAKQYRLSFEYSTQGLSSPTGLHWVFDAVESPSLEASRNWRTASFTFLPPSPQSIATLRLIYRRDPGTVRTEGRIRLRSVRMGIR